MTAKEYEKLKKRISKIALGIGAHGNDIDDIVQVVLIAYLSAPDTQSFPFKYRVIDAVREITQSGRKDQKNYDPMRHQRLYLDETVEGSAANYRLDLHASAHQDGQTIGQDHRVKPLKNRVLKKLIFLEAQDEIDASVDDILSLLGRISGIPSKKMAEIQGVSEARNSQRLNKLIRKMRFDAKKYL